MARCSPKVSVIILTYNRPPTDVLEVINSVRSMPYPNFEVILVDNSANFPSKFGSMGLRSVQLVTSQKNLGLRAAEILELGTQQANTSSS